ncbi:hypothetical protein V202x_52990 [Gimesia aquarii]|uniref:Carboxypeptidase regulatory-like domain-containing protein n=2 Tax=Gimesia aquarii TaxID=2527964 RepID=A0A517X2Z0_9PLAN|nr:hypothetical protein V202x_52990 [Gimesia aquarii]
MRFTYILMALFVAGCGGGDDRLEVYPTTGQLLLDEKPFGPTQVLLVPLGTSGKSDEKTGKSVAGTVDESGKMSFTTYEGGDGIPAGEYRVAVGLSMTKPPRPFPAVYRNMSDSPLKVTITEQDLNELTVQMESSAGPMVKPPSFGGAAMSKSLQDPAFSAGAQQ